MVIRAANNLLESNRPPLSADRSFDLESTLNIVFGGGRSANR